MKKVTKAVIAAAGFGTRFLPQTKAMPKEMLPLVDKPIIQYIVEDLVAAGIEDIIIVGSSNKRSIEDHFDLPSQDLVANLKTGGAKKQPYLEEVEAIANLANFIYIRQRGPYGTAAPLMSAAHLLDDGPFIYALADEITCTEPNIFQKMIAKYEELDGAILPCITLDKEADFDKYGILSGDQVDDEVLKVTDIIEKPGKRAAPSNFASVTGYLFTPDVFDYIEAGLNNLPEGHEFYLTDSVIKPMISDGKPFYGCSFKDSKRYDTGDKLEYLKTVVDFALQREDIHDEFLAYLRQKVV
jgi:UTP--glucose-1-phosphate uridylyltransferase